MGRITGNHITSSFSGAFGEDIVFKKIGNRSFFARKGVNRKKPSTAQGSNREWFAEAQRYASHALMQPELSECYSIMAVVLGLRNARLAAVKDFMSMPEIRSVDAKKYTGQAGDELYFWPEMPLKIQRIEVTLHDGDGKVLESGWAVKHNLHWKYKATVVNPRVDGSRVVAVAYDRLNKSLRVVTPIY